METKFSTSSLYLDELDNISDSEDNCPPKISIVALDHYLIRDLTNNIELLLSDPANKFILCKFGHFFTKIKMKIHQCETNVTCISHYAIKIKLVLKSMIQSCLHFLKKYDYWSNIEDIKPIKNLTIKASRFYYLIRLYLQYDKGSCSTKGAIIKYSKTKTRFHYKPVLYNIKHELPQNFFYRIIKLNHKLTILKPVINFSEKDKSNLPTVIGYCGIDLNNSQMAERNLASRLVANILGLKHLIPNYNLLLYKSFLYLGSELIHGVQLHQLSQKKRNKLYQKDSILRELFSKQLLDAIVGNVDANSTNIMIRSNNNRVDSIVGLDYDLSWGTNIQNIETPNSVIQNIPILYQNIHYFKGFPKFVDSRVYYQILSVNDWDMWLIATIFDNEQIIDAHMKRWEKTRQLLKNSHIIYDWSLIAEKIRCKDEQFMRDVKGNSYLY